MQVSVNFILMAYTSCLSLLPLLFPDLLRIILMLILLLIPRLMHLLMLTSFCTVIIIVHCSCYLLIFLTVIVMTKTVRNSTVLNRI